MRDRICRALLAFSALILAAGGLMHAAAFDSTLAALAVSNLAPFYASSLKVLWLSDSVTLLALALVFGMTTVRPTLVRQPVVILLGLVPGATAFLLYRFIGSFLPAHMLLASAVAAVSAGIWLTPTGSPHGVQRHTPE